MKTLKEFKNDLNKINVDRIVSTTDDSYIPKFGRS